MFRWQALKQLILARFREFYREPEALFWVYCFPLLLAIVLGLAFSGHAPEPPVVDVQQGSDQKAIDDIVGPLKSADIKVEVQPKKECETRLRLGTSALTVIPDTSGVTYRYDENRSDSVLARKWVDAVLVRAKVGSAIPEPNDEPVTEPGSRYIDFLFPGLIGMNLMGGGLFGVGFVIVDMRVRKLFKRLLATPMRPVDFLLSMLIARLVFLLPEMGTLLLVGSLFYGVPIKGDPIALVAMILAGVAVFDSIGLLIACRTEKTETASGLVNFCMLPMYLLSGTFFSSKRFPDIIQPLIQVLPLTQVNDGLREVMLEGKGLSDDGWRVGLRILALLAGAAVCGTVALRLFRWR